MKFSQASDFFYRERIGYRSSRRFFLGVFMQQFKLRLFLLLTSSLFLCASPSLAAVKKPKVVSLWAFNPTSGKRIMRFSDGKEINVGSLPSRVKLRAVTSPRTVNRLRFSFAELKSTRTSRGRRLKATRTSRIETSAREVTWEPKEGFQSISVTAYLERQGKTRRSEPLKLTIQLKNPSKVKNPTPPADSIDPTPTPPALFQSALSAVWANEGGDKVTKDELRASSGRVVVNSSWDGTSVQSFGAKNEVISFNLVLEAAHQRVNGVEVAFNELVGPGNFKINSTAASGNGVFNYVGRNIELFYVRYLQIKGLSKLSYESYYDERHVPKRFRRPFTGEGFGSGTWNDRPDKNKYYPDIAVPMELVGTFDVPAAENRSVWADIYIPKTAPAGMYFGHVSIKEGGKLTRWIPVELEVRNFTLPDEPSAKTMLFLGESDINKRYMGKSWTDSQNEENIGAAIRDKHFMMAHRHKISVIDGNIGFVSWPYDRPRNDWVPRLNGTLFTSANGYDGPGVGVGNGVFSIGTYGGWSWKDQGESGMRQHSDGWVNWFEANAPSTDYFLYLIDESSDYAQINQWASWINNNPGPGNRLPSFATIPLPNAFANSPSLDIAASWMIVGIPSVWQAAANAYSQPGKSAFLYNAHRPVSGSFATEDDGVALRELAWGQYKKNIKRWFFWQGVYYNNFQGGTGETNVFQSAFTFGGKSSGSDPLYGETGWNYSNGDGVLMYPGTDTVYPNETYGVSGPLASLRLKHWRRGIQDVDYLKLAAAKNPGATSVIVNQMLPKALWEFGVSDVNDPSWVRTDISWSINPDDWEAAREALADIIETP